MSLPSGVSARPALPGARLFQGSHQGYVIAIISAMLLAFTAIIIRALTEYYHLPTFVLAFWRAALVALVLLPLLLLVRNRSGRACAVNRWCSTRFTGCCWRCSTACGRCRWR